MRKYLHFKDLLRPYIWIVLGISLFAFSNGKWIIPFTTWVAPVFIVRFYRIQKGVKSIGIPLFAIIICSFVSFKGVTHISGFLEYIVLSGIAVVFIIPFVIDKVCSHKINGFISTLVLPLAGVTFEFLFSLINPYATWGSFAYTQFGNIPLMQVASVTGIWGISFLLYWFYSFTNWIWENNSEISKIKTGIIVFSSVFIIVSTMGGLRSNVLNQENLTVRIASISVPHKYLWEDVDPIQMNTNYPKSKIDVVKNKLNSLYDELIRLTEAEAKAGSKIIMWHESNALVFKEDESKLIQKVADIAKQDNVYILMGINAITPGQQKSENKTVFIDSNGKERYTYLKSNPTPNEKAWSVKGDGFIKFVDTPYGRIGSAICYDMDFPSFVSQAGKQGVDIMLVPASDWKEIDPMHARMAVFRAVENGFSIVRQTQLGLSLATDYYGNVISSMDYFNTEDKVMVSHVPIKGVKTIYSVFGDWFAWLCALCLISLIVIKAVLAKRLNKDKKYIV